MAKNDYFVVVFRILSYLYECFKHGERPNVEMFDADALKINQVYWVDIMLSMLDEGYIKGVSAVPLLGGITGVKITDLKITPKGIEYLLENSMMQKAKGFLKEVKAILPGI